MAEADQRFEQLTREYAGLMAAAVRRVCGRRFASLVPDVEQEVYLALWKRLQSGNEIRHPRSYLYKVALTTGLGLVRKHGRETVSLDEAHEPADPLSNPEDGLPPPQRALLLDQALSRLGPEQQRALRAWLAGFNHVEIAELFDWTESVARHRVYRGMEQIKQAMARE